MAAQNTRRALPQRRILAAVLVLGIASLFPIAQLAANPEDGFVVRAVGRICSANPAGAGPDNFVTIQAAVNDVGCDTVNVAPGVFTGTISIYRSVVVIGAGVTQTLVTGNSVSRGFNVVSGTVELRGMSVTSGTAGFTGSGGGIYATGGFLRLERMRLTGNNAFSGAGIYAITPLEVIDSEISNNSATVNGGGIVANRELTLTRSLISRNRINPLPGSYLAAGAAIQLNGDTTARIVNSTIAQNSGVVGTGIFNTSITGTVELIHTTLYSNTLLPVFPFFQGGFPPGNATTIVSNGPLTLTNSLIANPIAGNTTNCGRPFGDGGGNVTSDNTCGVGPGIDPRLDPAGLKDNGGATQSIALALDSVALDRASDAGCALAGMSARDQRGLPRPFDGNGDGSARCDAGAFESQIVLVSPTPTPGPTATPCAVVNLISNGEFNSGLVGWTAFIPDRFAAQSEAATLVLSGTLNQPISTSSGTQYYAAINLRINSVLTAAQSSGFAGVALVSSNAAFAGISNSAVLTTISPGIGYERVVMTFTANTSVTNIAFGSFGDGAYEAVFDNVIVSSCPIPNTPVQLPPATPTPQPPATSTPAAASATPGPSRKQYLPLTQRT